MLPFPSRMWSSLSLLLTSVLVVAETCLDVRCKLQPVVAWATNQKGPSRRAATTTARTRHHTHTTHIHRTDTHDKDMHASTRCDWRLGAKSG